MPEKAGQCWRFFQLNNYKEADEYSIIEVIIIPNFEFESLILSHGEQAIILTQGMVTMQPNSRLYD
jgi:hypothetical protein